MFMALILLNRGENGRGKLGSKERVELSYDTEALIPRPVQSHRMVKFQD